MRGWRRACQHQSTTRLGAPTDTVCSGVDEGGELRLVGGVEHEEMETGICVHHGYVGQIVVPFQGEAVVFHVRVYGRRLGW